jgi:hypothetical protein
MPAASSGHHDQLASNLSPRTPLRNRDQEDGPKTSTGPAESFESRTATTSTTPATSTQLEPLALLRLLFRQLAQARSGAVIAISSHLG